MNDSSAFEEFVRKYQDMVFGTALRLLGDPSEAEDISQTVFLKAFERFEQLSASPSAAGWLKTVATNLSLNHLTRFRRRWQLFSQRRSGVEDPQIAYAVAAASQAVELERAEEHARLERGIRSLPSHQRVPLVLFHFEDRSYREIAALLGVSLAKVKSDIHRGRQALRDLMGTSRDV